MKKEEWSCISLFLMKLIKLSLSADEDYLLAQVENKIWARQKRVLGLDSEL